MCSFRRAVMAAIFISMGVSTIDVTYVEVALRLSLASTATYRSSAGVVNFGRPATGLRRLVWLVNYCFHDVEITK